MTENLTHDGFLGGQLRIWQPRKGYRAGVDPVLLAASIEAKPGQWILELGCGVGVAALCLKARVDGLAVTGVEVQADYAELAQRNARENRLAFEIVQADLRKLPKAVRIRRFNHVIMNPPYFDRNAGTAAQDAGRDVALGGDTPLADWIDIGVRRLAPRGYLTIIQRMERLPEALAALSGRLGAIKVCPIAGREGRPPELFLLQARQEGRAAFHMTTPLVMHAGATHTDGRQSYTPQIEAVLRNGAKLPIWR